jgi:hypothetical protein
MNYTLMGCKTYIGAIAVMGGALCKLALDWYNGKPLDYPTFIAEFGAGFGILGIGAKLARK